jgi:hypothetical protein
MPLRTIGTYVRRWGFATPATLRFAQDPAPLRLQQLLGDDYPYLVQRARAASAQIHWCELMDGRDQAADDSPGDAFGKSRATLGLAAPWSMISTVSARGKLRWMVFNEPTNAQTLDRFLHQLLQETNNGILLMLDGHTLEALHPVQRWASGALARVEVVAVPRAGGHRDTPGATSRVHLSEPVAPME